MRRILILISLLMISTSSYGAFLDPTRPYNTYEGEALCQDSLNLTAIIYSNKRRVAIIDGQYYEVGDFVDGYEVTEITKSEVTLKKGNIEIAKDLFSVDTCQKGSK